MSEKTGACDGTTTSLALHTVLSSKLVFIFALPTTAEKHFPMKSLYKTTFPNCLDDESQKWKMHFLEKNWCGKKRMHDFLRKVEPKTPMLWLLLVTFLFLCVDSQGHTASPLSIHQTVKQVGNEFSLERTQGRQEKNSVFVIPLSYRIPRGREDIMRNILSSESRRRQLLGREREPLSRQLEQAVLMQRDSPLGLARRKNSMGVGRYFEQVVLGNVVNSKESISVYG